MDSKTVIATRILSITANRRVQAFAIAGVVLAIVAVLQVNNLRPGSPMCELLANANLGNAELQRMQIALSQSGLAEYKVDNNCLMVPVAKHSEYLQAVADKKAIPEELRQSSEQRRPSVSPFLSRRQQIAIDREEKKHQVREMILRLPFVDQAWFEMDKSDSHSAFEEAEQSAVVSIRPPQNIALSDQQVDTVKRMIKGAVAGLNCDQIVVIDLSAGLAHQQSPDPSISRQFHLQRVAVEQQQFYENQIRNLLQDYAGIKVSVHVELPPTPVAAPANTNAIAHLPATTTTAPPSAGANTFATIAAANPSRGQVDPVAHAKPAPSSRPIDKQITVSIDVPQQLVDERFPLSSSARSSTPVSQSSSAGKDSNFGFQQIQSEITQKIRPLLPRPKMAGATPHPITIRLIRTPDSEPDQWLAQAKDFAIQNWPSGAVLLIGLMLLSMVTRKSETDESAVQQTSTPASGDIVSIHSNPPSSAISDENPEDKLTKLLERDPDAAARVLEAWIRDAS